MGINARLRGRRFHEELQMPILLSFQNNDELLRLLICNSRGFYVTISVHQRQYYSEVVKAGEVTHDFKKDII